MTSSIYLSLAIGLFIGTFLGCGIGFFWRIKKDDVWADIMAKVNAANKAREDGGWIIADATGLRWRTMDDFGMFRWIDDVEKALRLARRADAELLAKEDEDAMVIRTYADTVRLLEQAGHPKAFEDTSPVMMVNEPVKAPPEADASTHMKGGLCHITGLTEPIPLSPNDRRDDEDKDEWLDRIHGTVRPIEQCYPGRALFNQNGPGLYPGEVPVILSAGEERTVRPIRRYDSHEVIVTSRRGRTDDSFSNK